MVRGCISRFCRFLWPDNDAKGLQKKNGAHGKTQNVLLMSFFYITGMIKSMNEKTFYIFGMRFSP